MFKVVLVLALLLFYRMRAEQINKPSYKYRYHTEDLMKTAESHVPSLGYQVSETGHYPSFGGFGGSSISSGGFIGGGLGGGGFGSRGGYTSTGSLRGLGGYSGGIGGYSGGLGGYSGGLGGYSGGIGGGDFGGRHYPTGLSSGIGHIIPHHHSIGGEQIDKNIYSADKKKLNDEHFEKAGGKKEELIDHGQQGYSKGQVALKDEKGDSGYYSDEQGGKKIYEDGKKYHGGQHFDQEGKNGLEKKEKVGHKKGHVIKGFKTSSHKDESGKTEEFYDEEHDEGDNYKYNGQSGKFGEKGQSSYNGGHENGQFNADQHKKQGKYEKEHLIDKTNGDHGQYGQKKYAGSGQVYGVNNGVDESSLLGHQESSRLYKHFPYHVPIFGY